MKRFIICSLLIIGLLWAGNWSFGRLTEVKEQVLAEIDGISQLVEQGDLQTAWERAAALEQEWEKKEHEHPGLRPPRRSGPGHPVHFQAAGLPALRGGFRLCRRSQHRAPHDDPHLGVGAVCTHQHCITCKKQPPFSAKDGYFFFTNQFSWEFRSFSSSSRNESMSRKRR